MENLAEILNKNQRQAVDSFDGSFLVIAGAGTGKTRVLEYRALSLVKKGVDPRSILLLTFTRRAAAEMLKRASRHDPRLNAIAGGTFHSFALQLLKKYHQLLGLSANFAVIDQADSESLIGKIITDLNFSQKKHLPKKRTIVDVISQSINKGQPIATILEKEYEHLLEWAERLELVKRQFSRYKLERNLVDYDDLLVYLYLLLKNQPAVRDRLGEKYRFIMVDEYQDTNKLQANVVYEFGKIHQNILVVGDEMQSIYGFRGANFGNMIDFPKIFAKTTKITLEENYRSTQEILDLANAVLDQVEGPVYKKYLRSVRNGQKPVYRQFVSAQKEAEWIAAQILKLNREDNIVLKQIAVLFRAAYQSAALEIELASRGLPFKKFGGIRFIETAHIKDVLSHLKVIENPQDDLSWRRILMLIEGVGEKTADRLTVGIAENQAAVLSEGRFAGLQKLLKNISQTSLRPAQQVAEIVDYYLPILRRNYDDYPQREGDLRALIEIALGYEKTGKMLADFALEPPEKSATAFFDKKSEEDFLTLSTIHSAKGLEWQAVFIIQLQEGKFPMPQALNSAEDIEEERRLFYVAVTRAKEKLFLTSSHGRTPGFGSAWFLNKPSRFIETLLYGDVLDAVTLESQSSFSLKNTGPLSEKNKLLEEILEEF